MAREKLKSSAGGNVVPVSSVPPHSPSSPDLARPGCPTCASAPFHRPHRRRPRGGFIRCRIANTSHLSAGCPLSHSSPRSARAAGLLTTALNGAGHQRYLLLHLPVPGTTSPWMGETRPRFVRRRTDVSSAIHARHHRAGYRLTQHRPGPDAPGAPSDPRHGHRRPQGPLSRGHLPAASSRATAEASAGTASDSGGTY